MPHSIGENSPILSIVDFEDIKNTGHRKLQKASGIMGSEQDMISSICSKFKSLGLKDREWLLSFARGYVLTGGDISMETEFRCILKMGVKQSLKRVLKVMDEEADRLILRKRMRKRGI